MGYVRLEVNDEGSEGEEMQKCARPHTLELEVVGGGGIWL